MIKAEVGLAGKAQGPTPQRLSYTYEDTNCTAPRWLTSQLTVVFAPGICGKERQGAECAPAPVALEKPAGDPQWSSGVIGVPAERKLRPRGKYQIGSIPFVFLPSPRTRVFPRKFVVRKHSLCDLPKRPEV